MLLISMLLGCSSRNAYWNKDIQGAINPNSSKASLVVSPRGQLKDTLFIIASSGGGSRAAYLSAMVMLKLEETLIAGANDGKTTNLLAEVDALSAVSGGTLPAAYYSIAKQKGKACTTDESADEGALQSRPTWSREQVKKNMSKNFQLSWFFRWLYPQNIFRFWFTAYDRSDIMAQVFANSLFEKNWKYGEYTFGDICDDRPNLIINATNTTAGVNKNFGDKFSFTTEQFEKLDSNLDSYPLANAVMSSAAFPAAFNYTTLRDFSSGGTKEYLHLFDGGNHDNLGLSSAKEVIINSSKNYSNIVVLLIDAYTEPVGTKKTDPEPRKAFDYLVDTNFFDSVSALLSRNRESTISDFNECLKALSRPGGTCSTEDLAGSLAQVDPPRVIGNKSTFFYHLTFQDIKEGNKVLVKKKEGETEIELIDALNAIPTSFNISKESMRHIEKAVDLLLADNEPCFAQFKQAVANQPFLTDNTNASEEPLTCWYRAPVRVSKQ